MTVSSYSYDTDYSYASRLFHTPFFFCFLDSRIVLRYVGDFVDYDGCINYIVANASGKRFVLSNYDAHEREIIVYESYCK